MRKDKDMAVRKPKLKHNETEEHLCSHEPGLPGRTAVGVDQGSKSSNLRRLRRIEGQIRGLQRMVDEDRYCADILTQVSSAQEALRAVSRALMRNHLTHCAAHAIRTGSTEERQLMYDELLEMIYRNAR
jgi:CsoR family transcriptional regulator, copper-sensing transcriptional repressor